MISARRWRGFDGYYSRNVSTTTWTEPVQLRETAGATRLVVAILATSGASTHTHTSCSVLGTALTSRASHATDTTQISLFADYVATGQAGDAVSVPSAAETRLALALFSFTRASAVPAATYTDGAPPLTAALALTPASIAIIGALCGAGDSRPSWLKFSPIFTRKVPASLWFSAGIHRSRITETRNISADWDAAGSNEKLVGAVWA